MYSNYNNSFENISNLENTIDINKSNIIKKNYDDDNFHGTPIKNIYNENLTHRTCVLIYLNPDIASKSKFNYSINHVRNCSICKNEISKNEKKDNKVNNSSIENFEKTITKYVDNIEEKIKFNENFKKILDFINDKDNKTNKIEKKDDYMQLYILISIVFLIIILIIDIIIRLR